jgi:hypothetical protein
MMAIRADSRLGRFIGALGHRPVPCFPTGTRHIQPNSALGRYIGALSETATMARAAREQAQRYEVVLAPAAIRALLGVPPDDRKDLADALRTELLDGQHADKAVWFDADLHPSMHSANDRVYKATPLSFGAVVVHRPMTSEELRRLEREQHRGVATAGFCVLDILHPVSEFTRTPKDLEELAEAEPLLLDRRIASSPEGEFMDLAIIS